MCVVNEGEGRVVETKKGEEHSVNIPLHWSLHTVPFLPLVALLIAPSGAHSSLLIARSSQASSVHSHSTHKGDRLSFFICTQQTLEFVLPTAINAIEKKEKKTKTLICMPADRIEQEREREQTKRSDEQLIISTSFSRG